MFSCLGIACHYYTYFDITSYSIYSNYILYNSVYFIQLIRRNRIPVFFALLTDNKQQNQIIQYNIVVNLQLVYVQTTICIQKQFE